MPPLGSACDMATCGAGPGGGGGGGAGARARARGARGATERRKMGRRRGIVSGGSRAATSPLRSSLYAVGRGHLSLIQVVQSQDCEDEGSGEKVLWSGCCGGTSSWTSGRIVTAFVVILNMTFSALPGRLCGSGQPLQPNRPETRHLGKRHILPTGRPVSTGQDQLWR